MIRIEKIDKLSRECNACCSNTDIIKIVYGCNENQTTSTCLCADCMSKLVKGNCNMSMERDIAEMKDIVMFYANKDNWDFESDNGGYIDDLMFTEIKDKAGCFTSGKKAREYAKKKGWLK